MVVSLISTVELEHTEVLVSQESIVASEVTANASKSDGEWKRSEDAANNKMKKRRWCIPIFIDQFSSKSKLKTCFGGQAYYAGIFSSKLNSFSTKYSTLVFLNSFALNRILYSSTSICF